MAYYDHIVLLRLGLGRWRRPVPEWLPEPWPEPEVKPPPEPRVPLETGTKET